MIHPHLHNINNIIIIFFFIYLFLFLLCAYMQSHCFTITTCHYNWICTRLFRRYTHGERTPFTHTDNQLHGAYSHSEFLCNYYCYLPWELTGHRVLSYVCFFHWFCAFKWQNSITLRQSTAVFCRNSHKHTHTHTQRKYDAHVSCKCKTEFSFGRPWNPLNFLLWLADLNTNIIIIKICMKRKKSISIYTITEITKN